MFLSTFIVDSLNIQGKCLNVYELINTLESYSYIYSQFGETIDDVWSLDNTNKVSLLSITLDSTTVIFFSSHYTTCKSVLCTRTQVSARIEMARAAHNWGGDRKQRQGKTTESEKIKPNVDGKIFWTASPHAVHSRPHPSALSPPR